MSSLYLHIPLCATRCIYCDFYSTTLRGHEQQLVSALIREMDERRDFLPAGDPIRTIYFGGGTPSQLGPACIAQILDALAARFDLSQCQEVTMEANPEDIAHGPVWHWGPINRISMGVQTMVDDELRMLHRRHDSRTVREAVSRLRSQGIGNISLDLMYGLPGQTLDSWRYSIEQILDLEPQHISAYNLMVEEGTPLARMVDQGQLTPCDDETCLSMASMLRHRLQQDGYEQYEISNYALPGYHSRHNSSYWVQTPYLGLGPGAHSYDGQRLRCWNAPDLPSYLNNTRAQENEYLSDRDLYNECVMLGLRTAIGVPISTFSSHPALNEDNRKFIDRTIHSLQARGLVHVVNSHLTLTENGLALADEVIRELFIDN